MSHCLVRCPFCGKRFNVTGVTAGTRLRCGWCTAVLSVPPTQRWREPAPVSSARSTILQVSGGVAAGLGIAAALYLLLRPPAPAALPEPTPVQVAKAPELFSEETHSPIVDDPVSRAKQAVFEEFGTDFLFYDEVRPYLVALERSDRYIGGSLIVDYGKRLETLGSAFRGEIALSLGLPEVDEILTVVVLSGRESFDRYCRGKDDRVMASSIKGIYEYDRGRVLLYHAHMAPYEVLFHEGIHQLVHHYTRRETGAGSARRIPTSYWFQEGLGTYFEGFRGHPGGEISIDVHAGRGRLPILKQTLLEEGRGDFISLHMLVGMTVDDFWKWFEAEQANSPEETTRKAQLYYAESWAFVHFLRQKGPEYQKVFDEYFRAEISGRGGKGVFEGLLSTHLGIEVGELEEEFVRYVLELK